MILKKMRHRKVLGFLLVSRFSRARQLLNSSDQNRLELQQYQTAKKSKSEPGTPHK